nr:replication protein A 70 kDa DNA-binding subunit B-like [Coffea arabica]
MEDRCTTVSTLTDKSSEWMIKVILIEKTNIFPGKDHNTFQHFMFADEQNESIQGIAFTRDVNYADTKLHLYHTYYIGNAAISAITDERNQAGSVPWQLTITKTTFIKQAQKQNELTLHNRFPLTSFWNLDKYKNNDSIRFNLLCALIQGFPESIISTARGPRTIRRFIAVNPECRPMVFTMWEPYIYIEGVQLMNIIHTCPIVLLVRPKITTYYGIDIATRPNSTIILDPPLQETASLQTWCDENRAYIQKVISQKLYEKINQKILAPAHTQIRPISQIIASSELIKNFWIKGTPSIVNIDQKFFIPSCPACGKSTGAMMDIEFDCNFCETKDTKPKPKAKLQLNIHDDTSYLSVAAEEKYAETLLDMTAAEIYDRYTKQLPIPIDIINQRIEKQTLLCEMRSYLPSHRQFTPLYFLTAFLPDQSSTPPLLEHTTDQKTPESQAEELIQTITPSEDLITPADESAPPATPSSIYKNIASAGSSISHTTDIPQSPIPIAAPSAKRSLDKEFDKESKHQKLT